MILGKQRKHAAQQIRHNELGVQEYAQSIKDFEGHALLRLSQHLQDLSVTIGLTIATGPLGESMALALAGRFSSFAVRGAATIGSRAVGTSALAANGAGTVLGNMFANVWTTMVMETMKPLGQGTSGKYDKAYWVNWSDTLLTSAAVSMLPNAADEFLPTGKLAAKPNWQVHLAKTTKGVAHFATGKSFNAIWNEYKFRISPDEVREFGERSAAYAQQTTKEYGTAFVDWAGKTEELVATMAREDAKRKDRAVDNISLSARIGDWSGNVDALRDQYAAVAEYTARRDFWIGVAKALKQMDREGSAAMQLPH